MPRRRVLLVDGDIIAYRSATSAEKPIQWHGGLWTLHAYENDVESKIITYDEWLRETLDADHVIYCLTDAETNWRKDFLPSYKDNRKETRKPMLLPWAREYLMDGYDTYLRPRLEGDDIMGLLMTQPNLVEATEKIIVSLDKDMQTIPGLVFNERKDKAPRLITPEMADRYHLYQTLIGDTTDGYTGCPGVGPVAADKILDDPRALIREEYEVTRGKDAGATKVRWKTGDPVSQWEAIVAQYERAGLTEDDALTQARVARILRASDYDFKNKEILPWCPPTPR